MYFINELSDNELLELINKFKGAEKDTDQNLEQIDSCDRDAIDYNGNKCIEMSTNRGRHPLFNYVFTDTTLDCYLFNFDNIYCSYNLELQTYLTERFGKEYTDFLSKNPVISNNEENNIFKKK